MRGPEHVAYEGPPVLKHKLLVQEARKSSFFEGLPLDSRRFIPDLSESETTSGQLKGVIVLEKGYSDKTDEAWVVVGISHKTIKAAHDVKAMEAEPKPSNSGGSDTLGRQPSEDRRTNQKDW